jgi:hypothetical protein
MENIFIKSKRGDYRRKNEQYYQCKRENLPLVVIVPHRKFASVEIDMITTDRNFDDETADRICKVFRDHMDKTATLWRSLVNCSVERVLLPQAETVATQIYNIAYEALPRLRHCCGEATPWRQRP